MTQHMQTFFCADADATARLATSIGQRISAADCLLLDGPVGAGKTHFARSLIQSLLETPEDVPSPTFTLVQTYETQKGSLWHADLYRLSSAGEVDELGLFEAMDHDICLIEWPDRLGSSAPRNAALLTFEPIDESRKITAAWNDSKWTKVFENVEH